MDHVGIVNKFTANSYGLSGPIARSCGLINDIRLNYPYELFNYTSIPVVYGMRGDNYTRFHVRLEEVFSSVQYVEYILLQLLHMNKPKSLSFKESFKYNPTNLFLDDDTMEKTILQFKSFSEGYSIKANKSYTKVESPKGEFGVTLVS